MAMLGAKKLAALNRSLDHAEALGVGAHVGAKYYTRGTVVDVERIDQTADEVQAMNVCAILNIETLSSTLVQSPAFASSSDVASLI